MGSTCIFWILLFLPACITIAVVRTAVFQWATGPQWIIRLGLILGLTCLIWTVPAGLAVWSAHRCAGSADPNASLCTAHIRFLTLPIVLNAVFIFLYAVVSFFWTLHEASHGLWFRR